MGSKEDSQLGAPNETTSRSSPRGLSPAAYQAAFATIIIVALAMRIAMLADFLSSNPIARSVGGDAGVHWEAAGRIANGQLIDDQPFLGAPLYPYLLAVIRFTGGGLSTVYVVQLIVHLATAGMIGVLAERKFGRIVALAAMAVFLALEEPAFLSNRVLPSTVQLFLVAATLLAADRFARLGGMRRAIQTGAATGLLALIYPPAMLVVLMLPPWMWLRSRRARPAAETSDSTPAAPSQAGRMASMGPRDGLVCGVAAWAVGGLVILPATLHNWAACGELIPITSHVGITFRQGNAPGATGVYTRVPGVSEFRKKMHRDTARVYAEQTGREGSYHEIDRFFLSEGIGYLAADPVRSLRIIGRKAYWFVTGRHYSDIYFPSLERKDGWGSLLVLAPLPTVWLIGPTLAGFWIWRRGGSFHALDWALLLLPFIVVVAFWYSPRYRLPVLPIASIASVSALVTACRATTRGERHWATVGGVFVLLSASVATGPLNAAIHFDRAEEYRPRYEYNRGQAYARLGDYEEALDHFTTADQLAQDQPVVLAAVAGAFTELDRLGEAEQAARRLLEIDPDHPAGWRLLGGVHLRRGAWDPAERAFLQALEIDAEDADAHFGAWLALSRLDRQDAALAHLANAVRLDPANAAAAGEYGLYLAEQGHLVEAVPHLQRATRYAPDQPETHFNLGEVLLRLGRVVEAATCFRRVLYLDPDHTKARRRFADIEAGRVPGPASTVSLYTQIEQNPGAAHLYSELAGKLYSRGRPEEAVEVLRRAVERADDRTTVSLELAWLLSTLPAESIRNGPEAVELTKAVIDQLEDPPPEFLDVLAAALAECGRFDEAVREAERAAALAAETGREELAEVIRQRLDNYRTRQPYRRR